jgi:hypothetical protein
MPDNDSNQSCFLVKRLLDAKVSDVKAISAETCVDLMGIPLSVLIDAGSGGLASLVETLSEWRR